VPRLQSRFRPQLHLSLIKPLISAGELKTMEGAITHHPGAGDNRLALRRLVFAGIGFDTQTEFPDLVRAAFGRFSSCTYPGSA
jgi:hypothetical protein